MDSLKQVPIIVGIAVLFTLFITLSIEAFYTSPKYEDFCNQGASRPYPLKEVAPAADQTKCIDVYLSRESTDCYNGGGFPDVDYNASGCPIYKSCNFCQKDFDSARKIHDRNVFFITAPIGIIAIIFGIYFGIDFIGSGFMFGGIATLFYGTVRYFGEADKYIRALIILVELLILVWIGYKKLSSKQKTLLKTKT